MTGNIPTQLESNDPFVCFRIDHYVSNIFVVLGSITEYRRDLIIELVIKIIERILIENSNYKDSDVDTLEEISYGYWRSHLSLKIELGYVQDITMLLRSCYTEIKEHLDSNVIFDPWRIYTVRHNQEEVVILQGCDYRLFEWYIQHGHKYPSTPFEELIKPSLGGSPNGLQ